MTHNTGKYIYESPDGGKTVYRRQSGSTVKEEVSRVDKDINHVLLIDYVRKKERQLTFQDIKDIYDDETWHFEVDVFSPKLKSSLGTDVLQQIKKLVGK